jgi:hypothetical protein
MGAIMPYVSSNPLVFLSGMDGLPEEAIVKQLTRSFRSTSWFDSRIAELKSETNKEKRISGLLQLILTAHKVNEITEKLNWINLDAIEAAVNDMKTHQSFDSRVVSGKYEELKGLFEKGFSGIYNNDPVALAAASKAIQLKRDILLTNPYWILTGYW